MILCLFSIILTFFPFLVHLNLVSRPSSDSISNQRIRNITDKIDQIALEIQSHSSSDKRGYVLSSIEKKLQKAAQHLGPKGENHVELIMEGIRLKAFNNSRDLSRISRVDSKIPKLLNKEDHLVNIKDVDDLAAKIDLLIKSQIEKLQTVRNKHELLENIKKRLLETVNEKQKEIYEIDKDLDANSTRRVNLKNNDENKDTSYPNRITNEIIYQTQNDDVGIDSDKNFDNEISKTLKNKASPMCEDVYDRICLEIKTMNSLKCLHDDTVVPLDKLCNDKIECPDRSDEKYCGSQAMERMQYSNWIMTNIESYFGQNCFEMDESGTITSKRNKVIQDVLQMQSEFKEKYNNFSFSFQYNNLINKGDSEYEANVKVKANEIAIIISSLALALDGALCSHRSEEFETRRNAKIIDKDIDEMLKRTSWPPKNCKCDKEHSSNGTKECKRICWQQNSLTLWNCESIDGTDTISLNSLCDGKLDCFDESDEKSCVKVKGNSYEKFEAQEKYNNVLKMVNSKALKERLSTQKILINLRNLIIKLQTLTMKYVSDPLAIKKIRNKCYALLKTIYTDIVLHSTDANESEEAYLFLLSVNKNLGAALKRSHTGNTRIIADGCYCRNGTCAKTLCSKVCVKACSVEPKLMSYRCSRSSNATVSVDEICNNKQDCPDGFDELNCKTDEICRYHHLIILHNKLQDVGRDVKGTALGELLISWKTKVISTIKFAEKDGRPKPKVIKNIVKDILRDLLVTYGSVEDYRRSNTDYALPEFLNIAQTIMETLKSCGK